MTDSVPLIEARGLKMSFGQRVVLDGIDLTVHRGESLAILGPSGSGKSTLLSCLIGLDPPDAGTVRIDGIDLFSADRKTVRELRQRFGVAFQGGALFGSRTVAGNVDLPLAEFTRLPPPTRRIIVGIKLALLGLETAGERFPAELSGGMKKRAALARAMALDPELLFCDEPSSGLDPVTAAGLDRLLVRLNRVFGVTLVVVTHELESAFAVADRIALIHEGRFLVDGPPDLVKASEDPIVRRFLDRQAEDEVEGRLEDLLRRDAVNV